MVKILLSVKQLYQGVGSELQTICKEQIQQRIHTQSIERTEHTCALAACVCSALLGIFEVYDISFSQAAGLTSFAYPGF